MLVTVSTKVFFTGRVLPDYVAFSFSEPIEVRSVSGMGQELYTKLSILRGRIALKIEVTGDEEIELESLRYYAESFAQAVVDSYGFTVGAAFGVDIASCIDHEGGQAVFGSALEELRDHPLQAETVLRATVRSSHLQRALADYRLAIQTPHDTAFYAYRAIESVREHFRGTPGSLSKQQAWKKMRTALRLTKEDLTRFKDLADKQRHGELIESINQKKRIETLRRTRDVVGRFVHHLGKDLGEAGDASNVRIS